MYISRNILIAIYLHSDRTESQQQKQDLSFLDDVMALKCSSLYRKCYQIIYVFCYQNIVSNNDFVFNFRLQHLAYVYDIYQNNIYAKILKINQICFAKIPNVSFQILIQSKENSLLLGHLSNSGDLLLWIGVHRSPSCVNIR